MNSNPERCRERVACSIRTPPPGLTMMALVVAFGACCSFLSVRGGETTNQVSRLHQIESALLYKFTQFIEWPNNAFTNSTAPLIIGVFGPNPFGQELTNDVSSRKFNGRDILVRAVANADEARQSHVLFFSAAADERVQAIVGELRDAPVLTVGESDKFVQAGGMIRFVVVDDKPRFEINSAAAGRARLVINAQLLKLAKNVRRKP